VIDRTRTHGEPFGGRLTDELPGLLGHAERRFGSERALDVVQETLLRALRAEHDFDGARPLGPWLRTIAAHVAQRQGERERLAPAPLESPEAVPAASTDGDHAETVARLLAALVPEDRALVTRHHLEGESLADIAASLGTPVGTVKARLWRARRRLALVGASLLAAGAIAAALVVRSSHGEPTPPAPATGSAAAPARLLAAEASVVVVALPRPEPLVRKPARTTLDTWTVRGAVLHATSTEGTR
jgi:RNA polymerase sigma-70 factor, ECF subfamily